MLLLILLILLILLLLLLLLNHSSTPSSTLENWSKELALWAPEIDVVTYWGAQVFS